MSEKYEFLERVLDHEDEAVRIVAANAITELDTLRAKVTELEYVTNSQSAKLETMGDLRVENLDLRAKVEDAEMLAERRKWGAQEMDDLRAKVAAGISVMGEQELQSRVVALHCGHRQGRIAFVVHCVHVEA